MAVVHVTYYTEPASPHSWAADPALAMSPPERTFA
jgi:hypothetical protein